MTPVHFERYGDPEKPAIVFLHGIRLGRAMWAEQARALQDAFCILAVDLPGHGTATELPFTHDQLIASIDAAMDASSLTRATLVGYSLGGYVAIDYAHTRPERVSALFLDACALDPEGWKAWPYPLAATLANTLPGNALHTLALPIIYATLPFATAQMVAAIPFNSGMLVELARYIAERPRFSDLLSTYQGPVAIANAALDYVFRMDEERFLKSSKRSRYIPIPGFDHVAPLREPQAFAKAVGRFAAAI